MIINVDGKEYRVHIHNGEYRAVYVRIVRTPGMMKRIHINTVERRVKIGGATWNKVVAAHKNAVK